MGHDWQILAKCEGGLVNVTLMHELLRPVGSHGPARLYDPLEKFSPSAPAVIFL